MFVYLVAHLAVGAPLQLSLHFTCKLYDKKYHTISTLLIRPSITSMPRLKVTIPIRTPNTLNLPTSQTRWTFVLPQFPLPPSHPSIWWNRFDNLCCNPSGFAAYSIEFCFDGPGLSVHCDTTGAKSIVSAGAKWQNDQYNERLTRMKLGIRPLFRDMIRWILCGYMWFVCCKCQIW